MVKRSSSVSSRDSLKSSDSMIQINTSNGQKGKTPTSPSTRPPQRSRSMNGLRGVSPSKIHANNGTQRKTTVDTHKNSPYLVKSRGNE